MIPVNAIRPRKQKRFDYIYIHEHIKRLEVETNEMAFEIRGKVALVTGGASGLGLKYALGMLEKGLKGVTLVDVAVETGKKAVEDIERKFGKNKAIFVKTDVTDYQQFEEAFQRTVDAFHNVDILINNAGILSEEAWQREVAINLNGVINGMKLALYNYIPKYKSDTEGLIVNISSVAGVAPFAGIPVYVATKFAVHGLTISWGSPLHYQNSKVRVVGVCPGVTDTPLISNMKLLDTHHVLAGLKQIEALPVQTPDQLAPKVIEVIQRAPTGTMWVIEAGEEPYQFILPERHAFKINRLP